MEEQQKQDIQQPEMNEHEVKQAVPAEKTVNAELFNKYRGAYLRERLKEMNVKDHEIDAAIKFIDERVDENDSNLDDVFDELKVRMRLDKRPPVLPYVDPSPMNFEVQRLGAVDYRQIGWEWAKRLKERGKI